MKIGVLSDTHIPKAANELPKAVLQGLKGVDLILHAGDLVAISVLDDLGGIAPTEAVSGNMDSWNLQDKLPKKKIIDAKQYRIGLIHGWGHPKNVPDVISKEFDNVDIIVFGHTHEPMNEKRNEVLFFNPGSPTDKVFAPYNSYGILEIGKTIKGSIVKL